MKATVLIENRPNGNLEGEHGLSIAISYEGKNYLLDFGATGKFAENAARMGVDLSKTGAAVLSHGHYDHAGGLEAFFAHNRTAAVYLQQSAGQAYYYKFGPVRKYVGMPKGILQRHGERFREVSGLYRLDPGVWLVPHSAAGLEETARKAHLYRKTADGFVPDDYSHEQSLVFETKQGLQVLNSCSHAGADVIVKEVLDAFPGEKVYAMVGGFHLMKMTGTDSCACTAEECAALARRLEELSVQRIYTGHCTGNPAFDAMKAVLGDRIQALCTGTRLEL